jgi:agmatine deiminase
MYATALSIVSAWSMLFGFQSCAGLPLDRGADTTLSISTISVSTEPWVLSAEFEPVDEVFLGWDEEFTPYFQDLVGALAGHAQITFVVDPDADRTVVEEFITEAELAWETTLGIPDIRIVDLAIDSVWLRDFGPLVTKNHSNRRLVDLDYWSKGANDQLAKRLADNWLAVDSLEVQLELEGGNLQVDGVGHCLVSTIVLEANPNISEARIRQMLEDAFGCSTIELLPPLPGEPTGHVDMFLTFTAPNELIVGQYGEQEDSEKRQHLEWIAVYMRERGYRVRRIPMPDQSDDRYRTYTNSLAVNDVVLVPYYDNASEQLLDALAVFEEAYPGRTIIPIEASALIELSGAVHCSAMTTPK